MLTRHAEAKVRKREGGREGGKEGKKALFRLIPLSVDLFCLLPTASSSSFPFFLPPSLPP